MDRGSTRQARWRTIIIFLHALLFVFTILLLIFMLIPLMSYGATSDFYLILLILLLIAVYAAFAFLTYLRHIRLLRILNFFTAFLLLFIPLFFIICTFSYVNCRQSSTVETHQVTLSSSDCNKFNVSNDSNPHYECDVNLPCGGGSSCAPLGNLWNIISFQPHMLHSVLMPLVAIYSLFLFIVLVLTLWRSVDERRFYKDCCGCTLDCGYDDPYGCLSIPHLGQLKKMLTDNLMTKGDPPGEDLEGIHVDGNCKNDEILTVNEVDPEKDLKEVYVDTILKNDEVLTKIEVVPVMNLKEVYVDTIFKNDEVLTKIEVNPVMNLNEVHIDEVFNNGEEQKMNQ